MSILRKHNKQELNALQEVAVASYKNRPHGYDAYADTDPRTGRPIGKVLVGAYISELVLTPAQIIPVYLAKIEEGYTLHELGTLPFAGTSHHIYFYKPQAEQDADIKVIHAAVGGITESDLVLAGASEGCIILGFNVRPTGSVKAKAKADGVTINTYSIIYDLIDDVKDTLSGMMSAVIREENTGQAEVRDTFVVPKVGTVAGCLVTDGKVIRGGHARIIRDGVVTYTGKISSLKRFKDDVKEVTKGYECGLNIKGYNDIEVGDILEVYEEIEVKKKLK